MQSLPHSYRALVLGASGTLGAGFLAALKADARCGHVTGMARSFSPSLVLEDEASIAACAKLAAEAGPVHLVVDATGSLSLDGQGPEKRLAELDADRLARAFQVNAIGRALVLKHFTPLLARGEAGLLAALDVLPPRRGAHFVDFRGEPIPW